MREVVTLAVIEELVKFFRGQPRELSAQLGSDVVCGHGRHALKVRAVADKGRGCCPQLELASGPLTQPRTSRQGDRRAVWLDLAR